MNEDPRCCGSGTCIIDLEGRCWCGQQWDGSKMCFASLEQQTDSHIKAEQPDGDSDTASTS